MVKIPEPKNTTQTLLLNKTVDADWKPRPYLGMSGLGDECSRKVWLNFRWASIRQLTWRTMRIFERGDIEEQRVVRDLKSIGIRCYRVLADEEIDITGAVGEEQEELVGFAGHAKGHPDGRCINVPEAAATPHLLEIKTMNDNHFKQLIKNGLKKMHPVYWAQAMRYMKAMKLKRTLHVTVNKNDEMLHIERIHYDHDEAETLIECERDLIMSDAPPARQFPRTYFKCKWCNHFGFCHDAEPPQATCRSCRNVDMEVGGVWKCGIDHAVLNYDAQLAGCSSYSRGW